MDNKGYDVWNKLLDINGQERITSRISMDKQSDNN
jgi:hypothetical protein